MHAKILVTAVALVSSNLLFAQKIKSDELDSKTKVRFIETTTKKISTSQIVQHSLISNPFGDNRSIQVSTMAYGPQKYLHLSWVNSQPLDIKSIDSIQYIDKNATIHYLQLADFSVLGRKLNMTAQLSEPMYDNEIYLQGDFATAASAIKLITKSKDELILNLEEKIAKFITQSNILVSNIVASSK